MAKVTIYIQDALLPLIDERDTGRGRSEVIVRMITRYDKLVTRALRETPPSEQDLGVVSNAVLGARGAAEAEALTDDPLLRIALLDAAERVAARGGKQT